MINKIKDWFNSPYRWAIIIALLGLAASVWAYHTSLHHEEVRLQTQFEHLAIDRVQHVQDELEQALTTLTTVSSLFDASNDISRSKFQLMVTPLLERRPDIMAISWAPRVRQQERENFEKNLQADGEARHGISEATDHALNISPASKRTQYFPVLFSEPIERNRNAIGNDVYFRPEDRAAMDSALSENTQWSSHPMPLAEEPNGPLAIAIFQPVFRLDTPLNTRAQRETALRGFVILYLRPADMIAASLKPLSPLGLDTQLFDLSNGLQLLHHHFGRLSTSAIRPDEPLRRNYPLTMPGRVWNVQITATEGFRTHSNSRAAEAVLVSFLLASLLFSLIFWANARQSLRQALLTKNLEESESRFRQLAENLEAVFWISTPDWRQVIYISPAYERIWGRTAASLYLQGMDWFEAVVEEDRPAVLEQIPSIDLSDWESTQFPPYRIRRPDGLIRWISARAYPIRDKNGQITRVAGIAEDISDRQSYQQDLENLAHYDPLTHLPNRRLLADRLNQSLARSSRTGQLLAICMLDLDGFKPVNDTYGHDVGDQLLIEVARRLQESIRSDDTVARLGGDEFVILLGGLGNVKELEETLRRLLHLLASPYPLVDQLITVSASIGVTVFPNDSGDADTLLRHADHAMYLAKEAGKNRFLLFNPVLEERERDNRAALGLISKAVSENQLRLFYQPIVDCRRGLVVGMEALVRWEHPILGLMGPAEFLPLVDGDDNLARSVGAWVMRQALQQANEWRLAGRNIPVSVNVFVQQLRDTQFPEQLHDLLAEYPNLPPTNCASKSLKAPRSTILPA